MIYHFKFQIYGKGKETFEPESDSGLMDEEKRNASLTTRAHNKEGTGLYPE